MTVAFNICSYAKHHYRYTSAISPTLYLGTNLSRFNLSVFEIKFEITEFVVIYAINKLC